MSDQASQLSPLKRAFLAVQSLQAQVDELQSARTEPIAVVGFSCRFPQAETPERYWQLLAGGVDAIVERPRDRWSRDVLDEADVAGRVATRWGGFLDAPDTFDAPFFGIAPREATGMDPQQRLFLEVCWEALEHAGIAPDRLAGRPVGVFAGAATFDYASLQLRAGNLSNLGTHYGSGIAHSVISGRVSYLLGLSGPAVTIDTACSSSLVGIHLACQSLRSGESEMALAGGVNVIMLPDVAIAYVRAGMTAANGRCKVFDAGADGFVRGEGSGVIVLKRLSKALADGDTIHALIRGTALNQDGASSSLTAPSGPAQEAVIRAAVRAAGLQPGDVSYVEAHGTGTVLGDPIELQAIGAALATGRQPGDDVLVGSVKSNIGHLEASAGVAGVIKVILSLKNKAIPASLHFNTPNPLIPWDRLPVRVPTALTPWLPASGTRNAGVSSFGFSGTNAHVVISEAPEAPARTTVTIDRPSHLISLSAASETALRDVARRYADHLDGRPDLAAPDVAHTANVGRAHFRHRAAIVIGPHDNIATRLRTFASRSEQAGVASGQIVSTDGPRVVFLFSGQGSQYIGMGRQLFDTQPAFRRALLECDALLRRDLPSGILDALYPADGQPSPLNDTAYTQPALFAFEYALAMMWRSWGVRPSAVMGHSLGEFVAATIAGVLTLEDALRLVAIRGRLGQQLPTVGRMVAVLTSLSRVRAAIAAVDERVSVAAVNAPESVVISGPHAAVDRIVSQFAAEGVETRALPISNAFHSKAVEPMLAEFEAAAATVTYGTARLPVYSNLFGRRAAAGEMSNAHYWTQHLREPVQFADGFAAATADGYTTFLEVGPHTTLVGLGRQCCPDLQGAWLPTLRRDYNDWAILLGSLGQLFVAGVPVDWTAFDADYARRRVVLPTYPFERQRYFVTVDESRTRPVAGRRDEVHPLLGRRIASPFISDKIFESTLSIETTRWLTDHRVLGAAVLPATAYLEAAWAAATLAHGDAVCAIEDLDIFEALVTPDDAACTMQLSLSAADEGRLRFRVMSATGATPDPSTAWRAHASGTVSLHAGDDVVATLDLEGVRARCTREIPASVLYDGVAKRGVAVGPTFRGVVKVYQGRHEALGQLRATTEAIADHGRYHVHPALLDAALHAVAAAMFEGDELTASSESLMPIALERFALTGRPADDLWTHVTVRPATRTASPIADVRLYDAAGLPVAEFVGLQFRRVGAAAWANASTDVSRQLCEVTWRPAASLSVDAPAAAPSWLTPASSDLTASASERTPGELVARLDAYSRRLPELDQLCRDFVVEAFRNLGWAPSTGTRVTGAALAETLSVVPQRRRLFERLLAILAEDGILARDGDGWTVQRWPSHTSSAALLETLRRTFADAAGELGLLASAGPELAACLAGRVDPLSLLFPGGSFDAANELYRKSPPALMLNALARAAVERFAAAAPGDAKIRVLEIGAGTAGTTSSLVPALSNACSQYVFTDLSPVFLARAQEQFEDFSFMDYRLLDIERSPAAQGFAGETFDLVVAANVLHATRDLRETLAHVRQLVRPGGTALLLEGTRPAPWIDLTFGLTDGWWRFADHSLRPDYPLISRELWAAELTAAGFDAVASTPQEGAPDHNLMIVARTPAPRERWLVFADAGGTADAVAAELRTAGREVVTVRPGAAFARTSDEVTLPATTADAYRTLLDDVSAAGRGPIAGLVHFWSLDGGHHDLGCRSVLHLAQAAASCEHTTASRLVVVTRGAQAVTGKDVVAPVHAAIWGLAGTIRLEHPDLNCVCIDLDPAAVAPSSLTARILEAGEGQIAVRDGEWRVPRLTQYTRSQKERSSSRATAPAAVKLVNSTPGVLDGLTFVPAEYRAPGAGEVAIQVEASALNFRDVLVAMGFFPGVGEIEGIGGECAGTVLAVGPGVTRFAAGDSVVAMGPGALGSHVVAREELVMRRPASLSLDDLVTVPNAFVTAWHSLYDVAELARGERVLIHAGAGGVGMAAIQLAKRVGAEIFATAGSPQKRAFLTALGVDHVLDSRSLAYADQIRTITAGAGVDVVLNSLADDHIERSLSVLADGGRFVELGKRGVWSPERVSAFRPSLKYTVVDLAAVGAERPEVIGDLLRRVGDAIDAREISPLPITVFPSTDVVAAFRYMAQAKHIGKVVVRRDVQPVPVEIRADATYLITGGTGGLGMVTAARMIERGAGHVVLMSRRAADEATQPTIDQWNAQGPRVSVMTGDVADAADVERVIAGIAASLPPLRGVVHSAGVLRDAVLLGQSWDQFATTFGPKIDGTLNLHRLTAGMRLDFFVLFSSISGLFGSPGQGNHAAANAFLDAFAHHRRSLNLPALSINWGAWDDVGAAMVRNVAGRIGAQGMGTLSPAAGVDIFEMLLAEPLTQVAAVPADWSVFARQFGGGHLRASLLSEIAGERATVARSTSPAPTPAAPRAVEPPIKDAPAATRWDLLHQRMRTLTARVLGLDGSIAIDSSRPLQEIGLDSLMAVELRNLMKTELGLERAPSATIVFDHPTVTALTQYVGCQVFGWPNATDVARPTAPATALDWLDQLEKLSPAEADRLLADRLNGGL